MNAKRQALRVLTALSLLMALSGCIIIPVHRPFYPYYHPYWR